MHLRSLDISVMRCSRQVCWPTVVFSHRLKCEQLLLAAQCVCVRPIADASRCLARRRFKATFPAPAVHGSVGAARIAKYINCGRHLRGKSIKGVSVYHLVFLRCFAVTADHIELHHWGLPVPASFRGNPVGPLSV